MQGVLNTTSLSQGCVLGAASGSETGKWDPRPKDSGGGEEPLITQVQFMGHLIVMSFQ